MTDAVAGIVRELKSLRKGRALFVRHISERIGPTLRQICEIADGDGPAETRRKIADRIESLASGLPDDLRIAVLAALAIHHEARQPLYQDRVRWVAARINRDDRTARRRIDDGIERLAEQAVTSIGRQGSAGEAKAPTWHTEELRVALVLDQATPEAFEYRRIVADQNDLEKLDLALTLTVPPAQRGWALPRDLYVDVFYGGTLVRRARESSDRFAFALLLPKPLAHYEQHEFALRYRVPEGELMAPHYVSVLKQRCDHFELRIRFDTSKPPRRIWRLAGVFQRDIDDPIPRGEAISLDAAGEIHLTFHQVTPGLAYGARWEYATGESPSK